MLEDPWAEPPEDIYTLTRAPQDGPDEPAYVEIEFEAGVPVRANGIEMPLLELIESLETIAGSHGVGRIDMVENRLIGIKSREVYEAPAAVVLHTAHASSRSWSSRAISSGSSTISRAPTPTWSTTACGSRRRAKRSTRSCAPSSRASPASVRLKLFKGDCHVVGRKSPFALYDQSLATYDAGDLFDRGATEGFIKIWGLPIETAARKAAGRPAPVGH